MGMDNKACGRENARRKSAGFLESMVANRFLSKPPGFLDILMGKLQEGDMIFPAKMANDGLVIHWKNKYSKLHFYRKVMALLDRQIITSEYSTLIQ